MLVLKKEMKGCKVRLKTQKSKQNDKHKEEGRSFGAVCRFIDKEIKNGNYTSETFKPLALESIINKGAYKTIKPLLNEKELTRKYHSAFTVCGIANRLDKIALEIKKANKKERETKKLYKKVA
tara:strand:- start:506 stop:874 length:369 start_codon:yes stop_codon:yes gene_type:complete